MTEAPGKVDLPKDDTIIKISEKFNELNKSLEANFKYQLITVTLFYIYINGDSRSPIKIADIEFNYELFMVFFPVALLYLVSNMAILTMAFIELSDRFFSILNTAKSTHEEYTFLRSLRPKSIFLAISLTRFSYNNSKFSKAFFYLISVLLYSFPGLNMALVIFAIVKYQPKMVSIPFLIIAAIAFTGLFYEFNRGNVTKYYRYLLTATYISFIISLLVLFLKYF